MVDTATSSSDVTATAAAESARQSGGGRRKRHGARRNPALAVTSMISTAPITAVDATPAGALSPRLALAGADNDSMRLTLQEVETNLKAAVAVPEVSSEQKEAATIDDDSEKASSDSTTAAVVDSTETEAVQDTPQSTTLAADDEPADTTVPSENAELPPAVQDATTTENDEPEAHTDASDDDQTILVLSPTCELSESDSTDDHCSSGDEQEADKDYAMIADIVGNGELVDQGDVPTEQAEGDAATATVASEETTDECKSTTSHADAADIVEASTDKEELVQIDAEPAQVPQVAEAPQVAEPEVPENESTDSTRQPVTSSTSTALTAASLISADTNSHPESIISASGVAEQLSPPDTNRTIEVPSVNGHDAVVAIDRAAVAAAVAEDPQNVRKIWHLSGQLSTHIARHQRLVDNLRRHTDQSIMRSRHSSAASSASSTLAASCTEPITLSMAAELEQLRMENVQLRERHRRMEEEARELSGLVREHERALETLMEKFRTQTFNIQHAVNDMRQTHMQALYAEQCRTTMAEREVARLRHVLDRVAGNVRRSLRAQVLQDQEDETLHTWLQTENGSLRELLEIAQERPSTPTHLPANSVTAADHSTDTPTSSTLPDIIVISDDDDDDDEDDDAEGEDNYQRAMSAAEQQHVTYEHTPDMHVTVPLVPVKPEPEHSGTFRPSNSMPDLSDLPDPPALVGESSQTPTDTCSTPPASPPSPPYDSVVGPTSVHASTVM